MKLVTYLYEGTEAAGVVSPDGTKVYPAKALGFDCENMNGLIDLLAKKGREALSEAVKSGCKNALSVEQVEFLAPIPEPKQDMICLGINYIDRKSVV